MKDQALYELLQMVPVEGHSFELGRFPVTNLIWSLVMNQPLDGDPFLPKARVSRRDVQSFLSRLNKLLGLESPMGVTSDLTNCCYFQRNGFRLPSLVELRAACLETTADPEMSWFDDNASEVQEVGLKLPNALGFYDLLGNVWEWCLDAEERPGNDKITIYQKERALFRTDSYKIFGGSAKTRRNTFFTNALRECFLAPDLGFRLARNTAQAENHD